MWMLIRYGGLLVLIGAHLLARFHGADAAAPEQTMTVDVTGQSAPFAKTSIPVPNFPLQFSATLEITAHLLPEDSSYPPHKRRMEIVYDYEKRRARADLEKGYEAAKFYIRRYDKKQEYMVRLPPINDCKRSYLGETMPKPDLSEAVYQGVEIIEGQQCHYFLHSEYNVLCHIYLRAEDHAPIRLRQESVAQNGTATQLLTYEYSDVYIGPVDDSWFELPSPFEHTTCTRHIGGFPYLHIFHYFVKF
jgi:hypothetical protein